MVDSGSVAAAVAESAHQAGKGVSGELKEIGKSFISQLFGKSDVPDLKHGEIQDLAKKDDKFKEVAIPEQQAKVKAVYAEYYAKKKKQEEQLEVQKEQQKEEVKKLEDLNEERVAKDQMGVIPQIAKTRTEIGKNWGQE